MDGQKTESMTMDEIVRKMRGKAETEVKIKLKKLRNSLRKQRKPLLKSTS